MQLLIVLSTLFAATAVLANKVRYSFLLFGTYHDETKHSTYAQVSRYYTRRHKALLDRFYNHTFQFETTLHRGELIDEIMSLPPQREAIAGRYTHLLTTHTTRYRRPEQMISRLLLVWGESELIVPIVSLRGERILAATFFCGPPNRYGSCAPQIEYVKVSSIDSSCRLMHKKISFVYDERLPEQEIISSCILPMLPYRNYTPDHMTIISNKIYAIDFINPRGDKRQNIRLTIWTTPRPIKRPTRLALFRFISILFWPNSVEDTYEPSWMPSVQEYYMTDFCEHRGNVTITRIRTNVDCNKIIYELHCVDRSTRNYFVYEIDKGRGYLTLNLGVVMREGKVVAYHESPQGRAMLYNTDDFYSMSVSGVLRHNNITHRSFDQYLYTDLLPLV